MWQLSRRTLPNLSLKVFSKQLRMEMVKYEDGITHKVSCLVLIINIREQKQFRNVNYICHGVVTPTKAHIMTFHFNSDHLY